MTTFFGKQGLKQQLDTAFIPFQFAKEKISSRNRGKFLLDWGVVGWGGFIYKTDPRLFFTFIYFFSITTNALF